MLGTAVTMRLPYNSYVVRHSAIAQQISDVCEKREGYWVQLSSDHVEQ